MSEPIDPTSDEVLIATEQHCIAMLRFLRLPSAMRLAVHRQIGAASVFLGEDRTGAEPSEAVYETAQRLAEGLRAHPSRQLHKAKAVVSGG